MAASLNTTVESLQVLTWAGELAGVSMGEIETATRAFALPRLTAGDASTRRALTASVDELEHAVGQAAAGQGVAERAREHRREQGEHGGAPGHSAASA